MASWLMRKPDVVAYMLPFGQPGELLSDEEPDTVDVGFFEAQAERLVSGIDGLILHGGADLSPHSYGQAPLRPEWSGDRLRDLQEIALVHACIRHDIPILGICRGHQLINVALGGTLYQDIPTQHPGALTHRDQDLYQNNHHEVIFPPDSELAQQYAVREHWINSVHHQAVHTLAPKLRVEALSKQDRIVEAYRLPRYSPKDPFILGVQWHPEFQSGQDRRLLDPGVLLEDLLEAVRVRVAR